MLSTILNDFYSTFSTISNIFFDDFELFFSTISSVFWVEPTDHGNRLVAGPPGRILPTRNNAPQIGSHFYDAVKMQNQRSFKSHRLAFFCRPGKKMRSQHWIQICQNSVHRNGHTKQKFWHSRPGVARWFLFRPKIPIWVYF
jgi:hypothetical protein